MVVCGAGVAQPTNQSTPPKKQRMPHTHTQKTHARTCVRTYLLHDLEVVLAERGDRGLKLRDRLLFELRLRGWGMFWFGGRGKGLVVVGVGRIAASLLPRHGPIDRPRDV